MHENVGTRDRFFRAIGSIILVSTLFWVEGSIRWFGLVGLVPLGTAFFGTCPLYTALGLTSREEV